MTQYTHFGSRPADKTMESVNIHIATHSKYIKVFAFLTRILGAEYSVERVSEKDLHSAIKKAETDFAEGKGKVFTIDELRAMTNEVA